MLNKPVHRVKIKSTVRPFSALKYEIWPLFLTLKRFIAVNYAVANVLFQ